MAHSHAATGSWARVELLRGESPAGRWDLSSAVPAARLTIGADPRVEWSVRAPDVAPLHVVLAWDGASLWVAPHGPAPVTINGRPIDGWTPIAGRALVGFGQAQLLVETEASPELAQAIELGEDDIDWEEDATRTTGEEPSGFGAPRFGDGTVPSSELDALEPVSTRIVDPSMRPVPTQPGGTSRAEGHREAQPSVIASQRPTRAQGPQDAQPSTIAPQSAPPSPPPSPGFSRPPAPGTTAPTAKFTPPPPTMLRRRRFGWSRRKAIALLAGALLIALGAVGASLWVSAKRKEERRAQVAARLALEQERAVAAAARVRGAVQARREAQQQRESEARRRIAPVRARTLERARASAERRAGRRASEEEIAEAVAKAQRQAAERLAVDALAANQLPDALAYYQRLAEDHPDDRTYAEMIPILRAKLRCEGGTLPDGRACE